MSGASRTAPIPAKAPSNGNGYNVPAVDKALDVLELLGDASRGMSLTGISDALGRTRQELFRVINCLHDRGYLVRDDAQSYRLSTKLFEIGTRHASIQTLIARAFPLMERLTAQIGESCHLNIVVQNRMLVVARAEADADVMLSVRVGATFDLHRRTSGLVGLAMLPESSRQQYWEQSGESPAEQAALESQLATIRANGIAVAESAVSVGITDYAAPIVGSGTGLLGVLCVSHVRRKDEPAERTDIPAAVRETAQAISAEFGPTTS